MNPLQNERTSPASPLAVDQVKIGREMLAEMRSLRAANATLTKAVLDLTDALDAIREEVEKVADQIGGLKVRLDAEVEETVEERAPENPESLDPPEFRR